MKQETIEELAKDFYQNENELMERIAFKRGYTECKERMYSEEDLKTAYMAGKHGGITQTHYEFNEWFEQFKKETIHNETRRH